MATIIDSLLITMGMDTTAYRKGQREVEDGARKVNEAERSRGKESAAASKAMAEGFRVARNELMSLVGIALGATGIKQFFANMVTGQAVLGRVAKDVGMSARELDAWGKAAETAGGSAEGLQGSLQAIAGGFQEAALTGKSSVVDAFVAMQIPIKDAAGQLRPMNDLLMDLSKSMQRMSPQEQIKLSKMLGIDQGTLDLLRMAPGDLNRTVEQMRQASRVTDESTAAAKKAQAEWSKLKSEMRGVGEEIFAAVIPGLTQVGTALAKNMHDLMAWLQKYTSIKEAAAAIKDSIQATAEYALSGGVKPSDRTRQSSASGELKQFDSDFKPYAKAGQVGTEKGRGVKAGNAPTGENSAMFASLEEKHGLPPGTLDRVWSIESGRGKNMVSSAGATGHFQFMPATAKEYGLTKEDTYDMSKAAPAAAKKLGGLFSRYGGNAQMALSAYNWGEGNLARQGLERAPAETAAYYKRFLSAGQQSGGSTSTVTTNIQSMTINTKATDAPGVARSLSDELSKSQKMAFGASGMR
jgi:Transglycosylase SLT domain